MSHYERNTKYLDKHRIIYRQNPISLVGRVEYDWGWFYENGTHECYMLFNSRAKITTYKSLKWHLYVLWYLNPQLDQESFNSIVDHVCAKESGFATFQVSNQLIQSMVYDVSMMDLDRPPPNKLRKIIFKDSTGLDMRQKLSIVGQMVGRTRITETEIYDAMLLINDNKGKITTTKIADLLGCSTRTIYRNMGNQMKKEKILLNQSRNE
jgi:hypothetical protein